MSARRSGPTSFSLGWDFAARYPFMGIDEATQRMPKALETPDDRQGWVDGFSAYRSTVYVGITAAVYYETEK